MLRDGGVVRADDDSVGVAAGTKGTFMAGGMAVREAYDRGWPSMDISGNEEFVAGARQEEDRTGLALSITTRYGLFGRSRTEHVLPKPPKLNEADVFRAGRRPPS